jgi:hypothetical protein
LKSINWGKVRKKMSFHEKKEINMNIKCKIFSKDFGPKFPSEDLRSEGG